MSAIAESFLPNGTVIGSLVNNSNGGAGSLPSLSTVNYSPVDASIELTSTNKALMLNPVSTASMNSLVARPGAIVYNTDTGAFMGYDHTDTWNNIGGGGGGGFTPVYVTVGPVNMQVNHVYYVNSGGAVTLNLPAVAQLGDSVQVVGEGAGLWTIAQAAGQQIQIFGNFTTLGVGGSLSAISQGNVVYLEYNSNLWEATFVTGNLLGV